jgi:hypothetical protein
VIDFIASSWARRRFESPLDTLPTLALPPDRHTAGGGMGDLRHGPAPC